MAKKPKNSLPKRQIECRPLSRIVRCISFIAEPREHIAVAHGRSTMAPKPAAEHAAEKSAEAKAEAAATRASVNEKQFNASQMAAKKKAEEQAGCSLTPSPETHPPRLAT